MMKPHRLGLLLGAVLVAALAGWLLYQRLDTSSGRTRRVIAWINAPASHTDWGVTSRTRCDNAPFMLPTDGLIGYLWNDSWRPGQHHQGIDIFAGTSAGETPVYAAYDGYLTRLPDWKSSLIIRIPSDPLNPGRQIWTYYTHMADKNGVSMIADEFPAGTSEVFVKAGTLLGMQGDYSGDPSNPVGVHLHFSIVRDDGSGKFANELKIENTLDPSAYFNLPLNAQTAPDMPIVCGVASN